MPLEAVRNINDHEECILECGWHNEDIDNVDPKNIADTVSYRCSYVTSQKKMQFLSNIDETVSYGCSYVTFQKKMQFLTKHFLRGVRDSPPIFGVGIWSEPPHESYDIASPCGACDVARVQCHALPCRGSDRFLTPIFGRQPFN